MKTKKLIHLLLALSTTYLLYSETPGLNLLILSVLSVISFGIVNPKKLKSPNWWIASSLLVVNGFSIFYLSREYHLALYMLSLFYFVAVSHSDVKTFYFLVYDTLRNTIWNIAKWINNALDFIVGESKELEEQREKSTGWLKKSLVFIIPAVLFILFLQLYRSSSANFSKISDFISLDWISFGWILQFSLYYILYYTWIFFSPDEHLARFEHRKMRKIVLGKTDKITKYLSKELEIKIAIAIVSTLSLLLLFLIVSDFILFSNSSLQENGLQFICDELHNGVNSIIVSIVITVALVSFILRGNLNFYQPLLVNLTLFWLLLNIVVVATTFTKNWIYVDLGGLTYRRVGVFVYLGLTFIGLIYTLYKVYFKEKFFFIFRQTGITFFAILSLVFTFNWDVIIAEYNLSGKFDSDKIDYEYLLSMKEGNQHILMEKAIDGEIPYEYHEEIFESIYDEEYEPNSSWKSMVYSEYLRDRKISELLD